MRFTIATFLTLSLGPLALADFNIDLYTSTDCTGDKIGTWTGPEGDGPDTSGDYEWTGHLGSVNINHLGQWNTQLNTNVHCLATSITCCQYAPDCRDGVNLPSSGCYKVDEDITGLGMTFTVCDTSTVISRVVTYPFRSIRAATLKKDVLNAAIRSLLTHITVAQSRYLNPSTTSRYLSFCKSQAKTPSSLSVAYNSKEKGKGEACAHWIGNPEADAVILYFHGGAFFQPATAGTFLYLQDLVQKVGKEKGKSVAALVVAYSLAPEATFPTQLREGAAVLKYLLTPSDPESKRREAGHVYLSGDSAGGNIALALVSHLLHPHPEVEEIKLKAPLGGVLLYSPSVSHSLDWDSMSRNAERDMLPACKVPVWAAVYIGKTDSLQTSTVGLRLETDAYSEPCVADASWWMDLHKLVGSVLVLSGGEEIFADPARELRRKMEEGWREGEGESCAVMFVETPGETHIGPIVDFMMSGGRGDSSSQKVVAEWWAARLEN
ncbi:uncharacterized protein N0V89_011773 [Didymosphaeria variabile]|uniref:Alpha/beta hydrolase fold-3 domain-containing protein n=1 Tax=Didymosphaeria variabile TaxID=1932322 RepID=A0A9W8XAU1_9PLEO|nr:uncharacterized protein N0V89_011773 [Didymosphaeria variabile]KAJ4345639.1 hypothetical protein N0V89_011773 [Didymosphaeria variabile]